MLAGGIYDQLGGGFARYSVDADLARPPLREDALRQRPARPRLPARLAGARPRALPPRLRGDARLDAARDARPRGRLLLGPRRRLRGRGGPLLRLDPGRRSARCCGDRHADADRQRASMHLRRQRATATSRARNILHLAGGADGAGAARAWREARQALLEARAQRIWPGLDDKRLTSWNALAIAALAEAGAVLGREDYLDAARACAELRARASCATTTGNLLRTYKDGRAHLNAYLEDHAFLLEALLTLYEASFEPRWFERGADAGRRPRSRASATPSAAASSRPPTDHEELIARRKEVGDHPIPSGNSSAAIGLLRLAALDRRAPLRAGRPKASSPSSPSPAVEHPDAFAHLLRALDFHLSPTREVALVGDDLERAGRRRPRRAPPPPRPGRRPRGQPSSPRCSPAAPTVDGRPAAYVCENFTCQAYRYRPRRATAELLARVARGGSSRRPMVTGPARRALRESAGSSRSRTG